MTTVRQTLALTAMLAMIAFAAPGTFATSLAGQQPARQDQGQHHHPQGHHARADGATIPLFDDLGTLTRPISTTSSRAQAYFDQGLRLQYAFDHERAIRSYEEALRADPTCAMCWWGIALASGPNINAGMTEEGGRRTYRAIRNASRLAKDADARERDLIDALSKRYGADPTGERAALDSAYARAMEPLAHRYSDDADILTLYGASLMNLTPWNYWAGPYRSRTPRPGTESILAALEAALGVDAYHPGACHYYIHAVEAAHPEKAVECAEGLEELMPGAGHLVHMPGHIYIRVGRYADAVRVNEHAVHSDESHLEDRGSTSLYAGAYYPHNYHFMAFAATMAGMSDRALEAARAVAPKVSVEVAREVYWIQNAVVLPQLTLLTFGRWDEVLDEPLPPEELEQAYILALYTRGVAHAALGDLDQARTILADVRRRAAESGGEAETNPIPHIAPLVLAGEIALRSGDAEEAVRRFREAVEIEDALLYEEPPLWFYPIRHSLGRALLEAGRPAEAERAYRDDLDRFPETGWSLFGLATALDAQGREAEAALVWQRFEAAWKNADVELKGSRF